MQANATKGASGALGLRLPIYLRSCRPYKRGFQCIFIHDFSDTVGAPLRKTSDPPPLQYLL